MVGSSEDRRAEYRVLSAGTTTEKPFDLARADLVSTVPVEWAGPKEEGRSEDDTTVESRKFIVSLDPTGATGDRSAEVLIRDGDSVLLRHALAWEVAEPISVSPKVIVIKPGEQSGRVILRSRDGSKFPDPTGLQVSGP
jgi:hypothetical protein